MNDLITQLVSLGIHIDRGELLSHTFNYINSSISEADEKEINEIEDEILRLLEEEITLGLYGFFALALKNFHHAYALMEKLKSYIRRKTDESLPLYLKEVENQLSTIPDDFKDVITQLGENYGHADVVNLINSLADAFYVDSKAFPDTASTLNKTLIPLFTFIINTLRQEKKYFKHVVAIINSLTENKKVHPAPAVDDVQKIGFVTFMVDLLFIKFPARQITIIPGNSETSKFLILIEESH